MFAQQRYDLANPPKPAGSLLRRTLGSQPSRPSLTIGQLPQLPNPNTPNNDIVSNDFMIGPVASVPRESPHTSSGHQLTPGSSSLLKRVAWPSRFSCTSENG